MNSVWLWLIPAHSTQMYGASATLGFGGSTLLITVLSMLSDLIGNNVVRKLLGKVVRKLLAWLSALILILTTPVSSQNQNPRKKSFYRILDHSSAE